MFKKLSAAAVIAVLAAFPTAAYASNVGSAINGVIDAGGEVADGIFNAGRDIVDGVTGSDSSTNGSSSDTNSSGTTSSGTTSSGTTSSGTTSSGTTSSGNSSDDLVSDDKNNETNSPNTGVTLGYTAIAAVLAAMGVMATAVRRKDD